MELGRETPDSTTCARLLEGGLAVIGAGFRVVRQSLAPTVFKPSAISRQPSAISRQPSAVSLAVRAHAFGATR